MGQIPRSTERILCTCVTVTMLTKVPSWYCS